MSAVSTQIFTIPEQGQIVTLRQKRFLVVDVAQSTLPLPPLRTDISGNHLVTLSALDDDSLGEMIQVMWEVEPGATINERAELPEFGGLDAPHRFDSFIDAVKWGAISSADTRALQAPFRSGVELADYQIDPVVRAVQMPRVSLLIADDVGLGKTIEAGLVVQELIVRHRARTVLIVCPAGLQLHWRDQMRDKFGLDFRIVDSDLLKWIRRNRGLNINPWAHFPRLITSIDFLKRDHPLRLFRETLPSEGESMYPRRYDVLIVDEAHNVAPTGHGRYAIDSMRTGAIRALVPHFEHKMFLSATPHNGYQESFSALLELLDDQRFARGILPDRRQLEVVLVRRLKSELVDWSGKPRFPKRQLEVIEVDYNAQERQVHHWLKEYSALRQHNAHDQSERYATEFVLKLLKKRLFSSPEAFALTLEKHEQSVLTGISRKPITRPSVGILRRQIDQIEEEFDDDDEYEAAAAGTVENASRLFHALTVPEEALLRQMQTWAQIARQRPDSKTLTLINWLRSTLKPGGRWNNERVIIFTEYRATQNWLQGIFGAEGLGSDHLMTLYGGMDPEKREQIKAAFQAHPSLSPVRILLATDAASEGIDLQAYCHRLIHIEIPWNPNRLEQRNGRIDRHGQRFDSLIYHFATKGYTARLADNTVPPDDLEADLEFLVRAAAKVEQIREDLGKVGSVIASQVEEAMLGTRTRLDTAVVEREAGAVRKMLKFERDLSKQIEKQYEQLFETRRTLGLEPDRIRAAVETALALAGQPALQPVRIDDFTAYAVPYLNGSWAVSSEGLVHPYTGIRRPLVFDHELAKGRDDVVLAHLNHRLVQMSLRLLRAEVWSPEGRRGLHRITARLVPGHALKSVAAMGYARLVVVSGDSQRLHEEVIVAGGLIEAGKFTRMTLDAAANALSAATDQPISDAMAQRLRDLWTNVRGDVLRALTQRMRDRTENLQKLLAERAEKEAGDIEAILTELARTIIRELDTPGYRQLELFSVDEHAQLQRNTDALYARLARIPDEIEAEKALIHARYADPQPRLFPIAVTFLVPDNLNRSTI